VKRSLIVLVLVFMSLSTIAAPTAAFADNGTGQCPQEACKP
jgi:hypothetical protein